MPRATLVLREKVRHVEGVEEPDHFVDVEQLVADFTADVQRALGDDRWPGR
jgi:hypothetical protein